MNIKEGKFVGKEGDDIKFRFTKSPGGSFSGIAFDEDRDLVVSFNLDVEKGSVYISGKPASIVALRTDAKALGVKVYDLFNKILAKHGERDWRYPTTTASRIICYWRVYDDRLKEAIKEVEKALKEAM